jgi:hypothetical protein
MLLDKSNKPSNATEDQDSAVVYSSSSFGGIQAQRLAGNRRKDPMGQFSLSLARFLTVPSDFRQLLVDQATWLFGSMGFIYVMRLGGELSILILGFPLAVFLVTLLVAIFYFRQVRLMAAIRLLVILIGILATFF